MTIYFDALAVTRRSAGDRTDAAVAAVGEEDEAIVPGHRVLVVAEVAVDGINQRHRAPVAGEFGDGLLERFRGQVGTRAASMTSLRVARPRRGSPVSVSDVSP